MSNTKHPPSGAVSSKSLFAMQLSKEQIQQLVDQLEEFQMFNLDSSSKFFSQDDEAVQGAIDLLNEHLEDE